MAIRVLIVDDSKTHLAAMKTIVGAAPGFEVVGVAADGAEGVKKTLELAPSIVLMDVNMPRMDGLEATARIMGEKPTPILLMTAAENLEREIDLGMRAIDLGALDLIAKPKDTDPRGPGAKKLIDRLKLLAGAPVILHPRSRVERRKAQREGRDKSSAVARRARRVVAVAASTGGPRALRTFLEALPANLPAAVVIVQHIDGAFVEGLVRWLGDGIQLSVALALEGQALFDGVVLLAPSGVHVEVNNDRKIVYVREPAEAGHCPSANRLLTSAARCYGANAIGVVLTGMGEDGARGLLAIKEAGGPTFAQDEATSIVYGMPRVAKELGAANDVLPIGRIAEAVVAALKP